MSNAPKKLKSNIFQYKQKLSAPSWRDGYEIPVFSLPYPETHKGEKNQYKLSPVQGFSFQYDFGNQSESISVAANVILGLADASDQDMLKHDILDFTVKYGVNLLGLINEDGWMTAIMEWAKEQREEGVDTEGFPT